MNIIENHRDAFSKSKSDVGLTHLIQCDINLKNPYMAPLKAKIHRLPAAHQEAARELLQTYEDAGVIEKSISPFRNNLVFVKKKDNTLRACLDLRAVNAASIEESVAIQPTSWFLHQLSGYEFFTSLDFQLAFFMIPLNPDHKKYTAFQVEDQLFQMNILSPYSFPI